MASRLDTMKDLSDSDLVDILEDVIKALPNDKLLDALYENLDEDDVTTLAERFDLEVL